MAQVLASPAGRASIASHLEVVSTAQASQRRLPVSFYGRPSSKLFTNRLSKPAVGGIQSVSKTQILFSFKENASDNVTEQSSNAPMLQEKSSEDFSTFLERCILMTAASMTPILLDTEAALAANGDFGPLEGRIAAFVHPLVMGGLFLFTLWAGYLGWQWRRVRTIGEEISSLKTQIPAPVEGAPASPLAAEVEKLTKERKELVKGGYRDRHFNAGSILLSLGVTLSVGGALNTWIRTGKLFPGPHLFAGAAITILWALAAALVPAMQKGNESARNAHIVLNAVNVVLFIWQVPTGLDIVSKILSLPWI